MNRKRLISILSGMTLSLAALTGPAFAADLGTLGEPLDEDEIEIAGIEVDEEESEATLEVGDETATLDPTDQEEPLSSTLTDSEDDGDDGDASLTDPVDQVLGGGDEPSAPAPGTDDDDPDDKDVKTADNDTVAAPSPYEADYGITRQSSGGHSFAHHRSYATQRPAPASAVSQPEVAEPAELAPEVAPPRDPDETEVVNLASTPITDPASAPHALKVLAALLVAGTALSWWNAQDAVAENSR